MDLHEGEVYICLLLTLDLKKENNVSDASGPDARTARAGRGPVRRARCHSGGRRSLVVPRPRRAEQRVRRATCWHRVSAPGDRVAVMMANRVEFVIAVYADQQARSGRGPAEPGVEGCRGRPCPRPDRTGPRRRRRRCRPVARRAPRRGERHRSRRSLDGPRSPTAAPGCAGRGPDGRPRRSWCSVRARPACPRRCATPTGRSATPRRTGARSSASATTTGSRWRRLRRTSSGLLNLLAATSSGATVRLHRRFDLDEVLRRIASERMTLEMAVAPDRPGHGQPPSTSRSTTSPRCATSCGERPRSARASPRS